MDLLPFFSSNKGDFNRIHTSPPDGEKRNHPGRRDTQGRDGKETGNPQERIKTTSKCETFKY